MSHLMCIIIGKFSCTKFLRLEVNPQKFCASKICLYTVIVHIDYDVMMM